VMYTPWQYTGMHQSDFRLNADGTLYLNDRGDPVRYTNRSVYEAAIQRRTGPEFDTYVEAVGLAIQVLNGEISDPTNGATHYHADYVNPSWADPRKKTVIIGRHAFYRLVEV